MVRKRLDRSGRRAPARVIIEGDGREGDRNRTQANRDRSSISRLPPEPPGTEARSFANWGMGKKARAEGEEMSGSSNQRWPAAKIQRRLRADESLIEMVRAERVFLASRKQLDNSAKTGTIRRLVEIGLKAKK
jgi:hypothetical protein